MLDIQKQLQEQRRQRLAGEAEQRDGDGAERE